MRVFRAIYKDRDGTKQTAKKWYIEFRGSDEVVHRLPAFEDKRQSESFGRNIEALVNNRKSGFDVDVKLNQWIEGLPDSLLKQFVSWGLIDGQRTEITKPLQDHISDYVGILENKYSHDHATRIKNRLDMIVSGCRFTYFRDVTSSAIEMFLGKLKKDGKSGATRGHYLGTLKAFLHWALDDGRILNNPIARIENPTRDSEQKGILTPEQFLMLIKTTFEKNALYKDYTGSTSSGQDRAVLYMLAGITGLRRKELLNLAWDCIILSGDNPYVRVRAAIAKNDKEARQPIPPIAVALLGELKGCIKPDPADKVFVSFSRHVNTAELIRHDLEAAEITPIDREGNGIVFHSLRNSYISFLANSGTPFKVVQKLARHSDPKLTYNTYARTFETEEQKALDALPNVGEFVLASCLAFGLQKPSTQDYVGERKTRQDATKNAIIKSESIAPRGFEPLLPM